MSHSAGSGGHHGGEGGPQGHFHYAVGDNFNPLGSYRLEHFTEGLRINNGIRFGLLFLAFFGWLYIVYWLRHHEPLLQQSIGMNAATSPTANQDKSIVASITNAFPFKTSSESATLYTPSPKTISNSPSSDQSASQSKISLLRGTAGEAISAPINYIDRDFDQRFGQPANVYPVPSPTASPSNDPIISTYAPANNDASPNPGPTNISSLSPSYNIPVRNGNSVSLRTVVTR